MFGGEFEISLQAVERRSILASEKDLIEDLKQFEYINWLIILFLRGVEKIVPFNFIKNTHTPSTFNIYIFANQKKEHERFLFEMRDLPRKQNPPRPKKKKFLKITCRLLRLRPIDVDSIHGSRAADGLEPGSCLAGLRSTPPKQARLN